MVQNKKIGIIGYGYMGQWMASIFQQVDGLSVIGVTEINAGNINAAESHGLQVYKELQQLFEQGLDGVYIASPNILHKQHVLAAAAFKIPVFCEKPIALTLEDATQMCQVTDKAGVPVLVHYPLRFSEVYERLKNCINRGELGALLACWCQRFRGYGFYSAGARHPAVVYPQQSGGWTVHHTVHAIDWLTSLAGPVVRLTAKAIRSTQDAPSEEGMLGLLHFRSGAVGHIADSSVSFHDEALGLIGTEGTAVYNQGGVLRYKSERKESQEEINFSHIGERSAALKAAWHFLQVVRGEEKPIATLEDGRRALEIAHAMIKASRRNEMIVL